MLVNDSKPRDPLQLVHFLPQQAPGQDPRGVCVCVPCTHVYIPNTISWRKARVCSILRVVNPLTTQYIVTMVKYNAFNLLYHQIICKRNQATLSLL